MPKSKQKQISKANSNRRCLTQELQKILQPDQYHNSKKTLMNIQDLELKKDHQSKKGESNEEIIKTQEDSDTNPSGQIEDVEEEVETDKKSKKKLKEI